MNTTFTNLACSHQRVSVKLPVPVLTSSSHTNCCARIECELMWYTHILNVQCWHSKMEYKNEILFAKLRATSCFRVRGLVSKFLLIFQSKKPSVNVYHLQFCILLHIADRKSARDDRNPSWALPNSVFQGFALCVYILHAI